MNTKKFDLEDRLIDFAILISDIAESLPNTPLGNTLKNQMVRSGTSPALNYGEAQSAESTKDFVHKLRLILKELRETMEILKIIKRKPLIKNINKLQDTLNENNELISIFVKSAKTALNNQKRKTN